MHLAAPPRMTGLGVGARLSLLWHERDREFESLLLQRGVRCELDIRVDWWITRQAAFSSRSHVPLHHPPAGDACVLDNAPVAMLLAILPADLQRKNMMTGNYRHIGGGENRLGRHYSRFSCI